MPDPAWFIKDQAFAAKRREIEDVFRMPGEERPVDEKLDALDRSHRHIARLHFLIHFERACDMTGCLMCQFSVDGTFKDCKLPAALLEAVTADEQPAKE